MGAEAKKYFAYARECARQADEATSAERREKLVELSRVWLIAALTEGNRRRAPSGKCLRAVALEPSQLVDQMAGRTRKS